MGNQPSSSAERTAAASTAMRNLLRTTGTLGLTKAELDKRCQPSGLYPSCPWEDKAIRRLIGDGRLAPRLKGTESRQAETDAECPICFLHYSQVNVTRCCHADLCTECYLQVRPQRDRHACCPFCNAKAVGVGVKSAPDAAAILQRQAEEQHRIEADIRARQESPKLPSSSSSSAPEQAPASGGGFGASLEQNERVALLRARSSSMASSEHSSEPAELDISSVAMTAEERSQLEAEMRAQHAHPLAQRLAEEESLRRLENEREYYRRQTSRLRELRQRREELAATLGERRQQQQQREGGASMDDLVVLEAALMLSMEEQARRRENGEEPRNRHEMDMALPMQQLMRGLQRRQRSRGSRLRASEATLDTAALLMRGISEEDQLAMAIAASLAEQAVPEAPEEEEEEQEEREVDLTAGVAIALDGIDGAALSAANHAAVNESLDDSLLPETVRSVGLVVDPSVSARDVGAEASPTSVMVEEPGSPVEATETVDDESVQPSRDDALEGGTTGTTAMDEEAQESQEAETQVADTDENATQEPSSAVMGDKGGMAPLAESEPAELLPAESSEPAVELASSDLPESTAEIPLNDSEPTMEEPSRQADGADVDAAPETADGDDEVVAVSEVRKLDDLPTDENIPEAIPETAN